MKENTNKILIINTIILYAQLVVRTICGFLTTRYALQALGVIDYGLYSVIGSIITFIAIVNTIMVSSSHRFIAVSIGKDDTDDCNKQFNVCLLIHSLIGILTLIVAFVGGTYYIEHYLNYEGDRSLAQIVFSISLIASVFSFIGVPFHSLLMAKEKFWVISFPEILSSIIRLGLSILLVYYFENKLIVYACYMAFFTILPTLIYYWYCYYNIYDIIKLNFVKEKSRYKEILSFSAWVGYGAVAYVGKAQASALLINMFFNTIMNTALGIANAVNSIISMFSKSIAQPIEPQITKNYACGNYQRSEQLLIMSTKFTYLAMLFIASPIILETEWILQLWLVDVPIFAVQFTLLIIVDTLVDSLNSGIKSIIFASGKIKCFQIIPSTIKLVTIGLAYLYLKNGSPVYSLFYIYIASSVLVVVLNQWILNISVKIQTKKILLNSYIPSLGVTSLFVVFVIYFPSCTPILRIIFGLIYLMLIIVLIGMNRNERNVFCDYLKKRCNKNK